MVWWIGCKRVAMIYDGFKRRVAGRQQGGYQNEEKEIYLGLLLIEDYLGFIKILDGVGKSQN